MVLTKLIGNEVFFKIHWRAETTFEADSSALGVLGLLNVSVSDPIERPYGISNFAKPQLEFLSHRNCEIIHLFFQTDKVF